MDNRLNIIAQMLELGENVLEGLEHICNKVKQGNAGQTMSLMEDILEAFGSLESAVLLVYQENSEALAGMTAELKGSFNRLVDAYEGNNELEILNVIHSNVIPGYKSWLKCLKNELSQVN